MSGEKNKFSKWPFWEWIAKFCHQGTFWGELFWFLNPSIKWYQWAKNGKSAWGGLTKMCDLLWSSPCIIMPTEYGSLLCIPYKSLRCGKSRKEEVIKFWWKQAELQVCKWGMLSENLLNFAALRECIFLGKSLFQVFFFQLSVTSLRVYKSAKSRKNLKHEGKKCMVWHRTADTYILSK